MRITGRPKSPIEFLEIAKTKENIRQYYQESLGPKLKSTSDAGSLLGERVLYHLHRYVPKRLAIHRPKYFVPGMPANVALMCVLNAIAHERYIHIDLKEICSDRPEAIALNRVVSIAITYRLMLESKDDFELLGAYPPETIGLMDMVRRNMALIRSTGLSITPITEVDSELIDRVYGQLNLLKDMD